MQLFHGYIKDDRFHLHEHEINHCVRVLRKQVGDTIHFITGNGPLYQGHIQFASKQMVSGNFELIEERFGNFNYDLTVAIAPTKQMDRMEWFVEKAVEMGITRIVPILCDHSERRILKPGRLEKIALSATKQSLKGALVSISPLITFSKFIESRTSGYIAHCDLGIKQSFKDQIANQTGPITILIGPEGDFSQKEIQWAVKKGIMPVDLGKSRLRTETAALVAVATLYQKHL